MNWISVEERLPKHGRQVLLCSSIKSNQIVNLGVRSSTDEDGEHYKPWVDYGYDQDDWDIGNVTHWAEIELPKNKG